MATETRILIAAPDVHLWEGTKLDAASADKASRVLQENHEKHHIFFNLAGLHNHTVHHILTILALGADPTTLEKAYKNNIDYQIPPDSQREGSSEDVSDPVKFKECLGVSTRYLDFLEFFTKEVKNKGVESAVSQWIFAGYEIAENLFGRFFTYHPLIHLACGVEYNQPALVVEALAETAVHSLRLETFFPNAEKMAIERGKPMQKTVIELVEAIGMDEKVRAAQSWSEPNKFGNGPLQKESDTMLCYVSQFNLYADHLKEKMADVMNAAAYVLGAAQHPPKVVRLDFFLLHNLTTSNSLMVLLEQPWISMKNKVRMVEWMGRVTAAIYALVGGPPLNLEDIASYKPRHPSDFEGPNPWAGLMKRATEVGDDGHASKIIRALIHGQQTSKPYAGKKGFMLQGDMWWKIGHMCMDSVEELEGNWTITSKGGRWVRLAGFPEAWEPFNDRSA